ncbi:asparaginyl beta-hydroxylase [Nonlabens dokdonensis]|uniref:Asparaginyl beta-hydroxylase n=1 Tax=Nonlabens dokdonensis TaxID=328515 RepID=A0A1Z8AXE8_9FLAO|nr:aspartyl/asparaginyl beta-hydroxylase domain-containing protein [Nonlabens dokdonensis]OUS15006.1 asparaginyl beta-hydroxylase [Nonlabens dokdonensis]
MNAIKLPFKFDVELIKKELSQFSKEDYRDIYNASVTLKTLWLIHLIEPINDADGLPVFLPNAALKKCPYLLSVFETFNCPVETFRIHVLDPGASIQPHRDNGYRFKDGMVRLHIPIKTSKNVELIIDKERVFMQPGECWYCDFHKVHEVHNYSEEPRIHLILDCKVNEWLTGIFNKVID